MLSVTPLYAGIIALFYVTLSLSVVMYRFRTGILLGDGHDPELLRRGRAHANLAEYAPLALLLMALAELQGAPGLAIHLLGLLLVAGRIIHALAIRLTDPPLVLRTLGMVATFSVILLASLGNIFHALS